MSRASVISAAVIRAALVVSVALLVTTGCSMPASDLQARADTSPGGGDAIIGHVIDVVRCDGYMLVDFPWGRTTVSVGNRELDHFQAGENVVFDRNLRPVRAVRSGI